MWSSTIQRTLSIVTCLALGGACTSACVDVYSLPDPGPESEWVDLGAGEGEDEQVQLRRYLGAKRTAIDVYKALDDGEWEGALALMSQETRNFLEDGSDGQGAASALASGELTFGGQTVEFEPVADLMITDLEQIVDDLPGQEQAETPRRKELFLVATDGRARKVVFIFEGDAWLLHSPFLNTRMIEGAN